VALFREENQLGLSTHGVEEDIDLHRLATPCPLAEVTLVDVDGATYAHQGTAAPWANTRMPPNQVYPVVYREPDYFKENVGAVAEEPHLAHADFDTAIGDPWDVQNPHEARNR